MPPAVKITTANTKKPKKIVFDEDGDSHETAITLNDSVKTENESDTEDYFAKREKLKQLKKQESQAVDESQQKWFDVFTQVILKDSDDVLDMKEKEQMELYNICKSSFDAEKSAFNKRNPTDARWLQTALHKGTAKDRANAGALLVTSNPLGNLEALSNLIEQTKISNKSCNDVVGVLTDLWQEVLLPPQRKLIAIKMRGADWKLIRNDTSLPKERQRRIYAYWYFENELKEAYFEFLKNMQHSLQSGQENNKFVGIVAAAKLLSYAPEKEQMLLTMIINKLGDPLAKVASKALHHLTEVAQRHPNMCGVIVLEAEKLLFRNNISERAQHFALCFLASIASSGTAEVCTKLVNICFALFKVAVQKGAVNNRTMQAILRCLQKAIVDAQPVKGSTEILSKDMQDTVYRLVHLADIRISVQTLGLLLQLITVKTDTSDRFYNALYKKMLDLELVNIGTKTAAQLLHIIHRAIHIDSNLKRAKAFLKRLLQMTLYMPSNIAAGCLIVVHKLISSRKELASLTVLPVPNGVKDEIATENENEGKEENETKMENDIVTKKTQTVTSKYDPFHRVPSFAGAEYALRTELISLCEHVHPTVKLFAQNILNQKRITYYGDPLRDFGLPHFLERFAFKNPKKLDQYKAENPTISHKRYAATGARGQSVKALTKESCTEDELYIFNFLEQKRQQATVNKNKKSNDSETAEEEEEGLKASDVNDDEFDDYLDEFFGKKGKNAKKDLGNNDDDDLDFLKELGGELKEESKSKKAKKKRNLDDDEDVDDIDADWGDDDEQGDEEFDFNGKGSDNVSEDDEASIDLNDDENDDDDDDDGGSVSFDDDNNSDESDNDDDDDDNIEDDDDELLPTKNKKKKSGMLNDKGFTKKLKDNKDMSSLFAAADEFADLLEQTAKARGQGTKNAVFNKDKSSDKQMKWEEGRRSNSKTYADKRKRTFGTAKPPKKNFAKKFKH